MDVIIYGTGKLGQMVYYMMKDDSRYNLVCFTADQEYCDKDHFLSLPLVPFDQIQQVYPPDTHQMITVVGGFGGARVRRDMFLRAKNKGYQHINYIHPSVVIQGDIELGENNIVFPFCILGFRGKMGDDNLLREKVYLGHEFQVGSHNFVGVGCNLGGEIRVDNLTYIAMDTTVTNNMHIAEESFIGIGSLVLKETDPYSKYYGRPAKKASENREEGIIINGRK